MGRYYDADKLEAALIHHGFIDPDLVTMLNKPDGPRTFYGVPSIEGTLITEEKARAEVEADPCQRLVDANKGVRQFRESLAIELGATRANEDPTVFAMALKLAISMLEYLPTEHEYSLLLEKIPLHFVELAPYCPICGTKVDKDQVEWK